MAHELAHELIHELATCEIGLQFMCELYNKNDNATHLCTEFKFVTTLRANEPSQTLLEAEESFFAKYRTYTVFTHKHNISTSILTYHKVCLLLICITLEE